MQYRICKKYISPLFLIPLFICCINAKEYSLSSDWPDSPKKKCWPNLSSDLIMTDRGDTGSYRNITASITVEGHSYSGNWKVIGSDLSQDTKHID